MNKKIFYLFSAALLIGGLTGCSSSDDPGSEVNQINPTRIGEALDDITSQMQSSIFNCNQAKSRTRAASDIDALIPQKDDVSFNNKVPSNAEDVTKDDSKPWEEGHTWLVPKGKNKSDLQLNMKDATLYVEGTATLTNAYNANGKIIVKNGGHLIINKWDNRFFGNGGTAIIEKGGKVTSASGTLHINADDKVYVEGDLTTIDNIAIQGRLYVGGDLSAKQFLNPTNTALIGSFLSLTNTV